MPHPGQMLGDRYRLDDRIAAGGMGEVWQATDTVLGRDVAVKTLHAGQAGDVGFQNRFRHEARAMAVLHHPGVADVYDYGQTGDGADAYIVMAHVQGQPLSQRIAERGRLSPVETMSIVAQAGRALDAAHQAGIVHRDVKPSNLIVQPDGTVVLVDFGVARSTESAALTGAKEVVGTALYIAPEQVSKQTTGPPADVYALGAVAYHCLSGHPPFLGPNALAVALQHLHDDPPALPPEVPEPVRVLVSTAMAKDPALRFTSAAAMADAADAARRILSGPSDSTAALAVPFGAAGLASTTPDLAAVGAATVPAAQATVTPEYQDGPSTPTKRRRGPLIALAALLLALAGIATVLAVFAPGAFRPGSPDASSSPSVSPSAKSHSAAPPPTTRSSHRQTATTRATTTAPAGGTATRTTTPTPSPTPTATAPTTTAPTQTATTAAGSPAG